MPSDYVEELDSYQAFQFDLAMAVKGYLKDKETESDNIHTLLEGMRGIMKSNGGKPGKIPKPKKLVKDPDFDKLPTLNDVLGAFGGVGVAIQEEAA